MKFPTLTDMSSIAYPLRQVKERTKIKFKKPNWKQLLGLETEHGWRYYIRCAALHPYKPDELDGIENDPPWSGRLWLARRLSS